MTQASASVSFTGKPFDLLDPSVPIEEETVPSYTPCEWYPVTIGAIFNSRYRVLGKLGWGRHSTTWFSKDLQYVLNPERKTISDEKADQKTM